LNIASLDLGSNTFLLTIAELSNHSFKILHDECVVTRLAQGVDATGSLHADALARAEQCFQGFAQTLKKYDAKRISAMATSAARDAKNGEEFIALGKKYNIPIEIISGEREARLTFLGGTYQLPAMHQPVVVDVGGGSTEYIVQANQKQLFAQSLDIGSVRLTEKFITENPIARQEQDAVREYIVQQLERLPSEMSSYVSTMVAVAGTPTTLACLMEEREFDITTMHGKHILLSDLRRWLDKLAGMSVEQRLELTGMQPGRADVIVCGLCILEQSLDFFKMDQLTVSCTGVRYGLLQEMANESS